MTTDKSALERVPGRRDQRPTANLALFPTLDLGPWTLDLGPRPEGKFLGRSPGLFVSLLIDGDEKVALPAVQGLVERTDEAAVDAFGLTADAQRVRPPGGGNLQDDRVLARPFEQVPRRRFELEEHRSAAIERAAGGDRIQRRQQVVFHARRFLLADAGARAGQVHELVLARKVDAERRGLLRRLLHRDRACRARFVQRLRQVIDNDERSLSHL